MKTLTKSREMYELGFEQGLIRAYGLNTKWTRSEIAIRRKVLHRMFGKKRK